METKNILQNIFAKKTNTIIFIAFIAVLSVLCISLSPLFFGNFIEVLLKNPSDSNNLIMWGAIVGGLVLLRVLLEFIKQTKLYSLSYDISSELKKEAYKCVLKADLNNVENIDSDEIAKRIYDYCDKISYDYICNSVVMFITSSLYLVSSFIISVVVSPVCCSILTLGAIVYYFSLLLIKKAYSKNKEAVNTNTKESKTMIVENFKKLEDVKSKNGIEFEINEFNNKINNFKSKKVAYYKEKFWKDSYLKVLLEALLVTTCAFTGIYCYLNDMYNTSFAGIIACLIFIPTILQSITIISSSKIKYSSIEVETKKLDEIFQIKAETRTEPISSLDELFSIRFTNVCFNSNNKQLVDLSFEVQNNEKLGILCLDDYSNDMIYNLLIKTSKPRSGSITFNNCESAKINTYYLRNLITAVSHNTGLFDENIITNITYPLPFDEYKYNDSLYKAKLKDPIFDLENKDETNVTLISDEMKQQVALGGAFYKDSKVFLFNNATSKLSLKLEEEIIKEIYKLKNKFIIMLSDKAQNLSLCDKVLVIDNGKVVEYGQTSELAKNKDSIFFKSTRKIRLASKKIS